MEGRRGAQGPNKARVAHRIVRLNRPIRTRTIPEQRSEDPTMNSARRRKPDLLFVFGVIFFALFAAPRFAYAWGPSVHLWIGETLIQTAGAAVPLAAALLRRHRR